MPIESCAKIAQKARMYNREEEGNRHGGQEDPRKRGMRRTKTATDGWVAKAGGFCNPTVSNKGGGKGPTGAMGFMGFMGFMEVIGLIGPIGLMGVIMTYNWE